MSKQVVIAVPTYKPFSKLSESELISWHQFTKVYKHYDFVLICPQSLDTSGYVSISLNNPPKVERFEDSYFISTDSYNKLLLSLNFYLRFTEYEFFLLCQLDVFVFYDALPSWCAKGYSYVGAPWFMDFEPPIEQARLWRVGNGGFSLRRVADSIRVLNTRKQIFTVPTLLREYFAPGFLTGIKQLFREVPRLLKGNNTHHLYNDYPDQEDVFWSVICHDLFDWYTAPTATEALAFGFDYHPTLMLSLNEGRLPMGFHGWDRHRNEFWARTFAEAGYILPKIQSDE